MSFKPCYKWIPFNTWNSAFTGGQVQVVLNLVINGYPSILESGDVLAYVNNTVSFKPCYKWIPFNT